MLFLNISKQLSKSAYLFKNIVKHKKVNFTRSASQIGYLLGVYENNDNISFTKSSAAINDETSHKLRQLLDIGGPVKEGKSRTLYGLSDEYPIVSIVGLGDHDALSKPIEECDDRRERIRTAVAAGCRSLKAAKVSKILVDPCGDGLAAGEGATLSLFTYDDLKTKKNPSPPIECLEPKDIGWVKGVTLAEGQNIARKLAETPANIMTPTKFAQEAIEYLEGLGVQVHVRTEDWAKQRNMNAFLSVGKGSAEPSVFLEIAYQGATAAVKPLAIVGKGVTFDAGGISLKPSKGMELMRGDMGGAACTVGSIFAIATLQIPINIKGFIPLCENLPSGKANKPGDVIVASNGKSIQIDNTDAEGRLILADALHYASQHKPRVILDMATLTGAMATALGAGPTGAFSNSLPLFNLIHKAGCDTGDRMWRMPLWDIYSKQVTEFGYADVHNIGKHSGAGACKAAAFLQQFVECDHWIHLDIAGVMENKDEVPYLGKGMSGRPTRTVVEFASLLSKSADL